jgi:hypothetical protein
MGLRADPYLSATISIVAIRTRRSRHRRGTVDNSIAEGFEPPRYIAVPVFKNDINTFDTAGGGVCR